jgi:hypothetical protein
MLPNLALTPDRLTAFPPAVLTGAVLHTFCVPADETKIQAALDQRYSAPSAGQVRYKAIGSQIFVSVAEIARMVSTDPMDAMRGGMSEIDVTIWALARREGSLSIRWLPLWLFVDSAPAMATGREVYGFPKQIGRFDFSPQDQKPRRFGISAFVSPTFTPQTMALWAPMIDIAPSAAAPDPGAGEPWGGLEDMARRLIERLGAAVVNMDLALLGAASVALGTGRTTMALLKQFPDAAQPHLACYQGIIEVEAAVDALHESKLTSTPYTVEIQNYASHPILEQFGVQPGPLEVGHGIVVNFDFRMGVGTEIWRAS